MCSRRGGGFEAALELTGALVDDGAGEAAAIVLAEGAVEQDLEASRAHPRHANRTIEEERKLRSATVTAAAAAAIAGLSERGAHRCGEEGGRRRGSLRASSR